MNKILLVLLAFIILFQFNSIASNGEKNGYSIIEVVTPAKVVYDDGIYRIQFSSFCVVDEMGNKIISSGEVFDYAAVIKLIRGNYTVYYMNLKNEIVQSNLRVDEKKFLRIKLD